ncbi:type 1 fimbrial protein [Salmonella enterica]|nr:type 1 fimbrial protein [Salmonella enterica]
MNKFAKLSLLALCITGFSGVASAAEVGAGTVSLTGLIGPATCAVAPSAPGVTIPELDAVNIMSAAVDSELSKQSITLDFTACGGINTLDVALSRDVNAPTGSDAAQTNAGFTYTGGAMTDSATGPLYLNIKSGANTFNLDGSAGNIIDITSITDKSAFSVPVDFVINKAADNGVPASLYTGTYAASVTYAITYP